MHTHGLGLLPALVMSAIGVAILLWLALRRRKLTLLVAHLHLWREAPLRRTRRSHRALELVLSLLAFVGFVGAAADLRWGAGPETTVWLVIDGAASLEARTLAGLAGRGPRSRREAIRLRAHERVTTLLEGGDAHAQVGVVLAGSIPRVVASPTRDAKLAHRAIDEATSAASWERPRQPTLDEATGLVRDLSASLQSWKTEVLGALEATAPNAALVRAEADPARGSLVVHAYAEDARWTGRFVEVRDGASDRRLAKAAFVPAAGDSAARAEVHGPLALLRFPWRREPGARRLDIVLRDETGRDPHDGDDRLELVIPEPRPLRVRRLGAPDAFLDAALSALRPEVTVVSAPPFDVIVGEQIGPSREDPVWANTPALLFAPPRATSTPAAPFSGGGEEKMALLEEPRASPTTRHPLLEGISLADVNVGRLHRYDPVPGDEVLATGRRQPAVFVRRQGAIPWLVVAFAPGDSDFPLRPSFPLFVSQALRWAGPTQPPTRVEGATPREARLTSQPIDATSGLRSDVPEGSLPHALRGPVWPWLTALALAASLGLLAHAHRRGRR